MCFLRPWFTSNTVLLVHIVTIASEKKDLQSIIYPCVVFFYLCWFWLTFFLVFINGNIYLTANLLCESHCPPPFYNLHNQSLPKRKIPKQSKSTTSREGLVWSLQYCPPTLPEAEKVLVDCEMGIVAIIFIWTVLAIVPEKEAY